MAATEAASSSTPWGAIAYVGLGFLDSAFSAGSARDEARANLTSIDEQIALLNKQRQQLATAYDQKKGIVTDQFGNKIKSFEFETGLEGFNIREGADRASSKTNLAYSGTVETTKERELDTLSSRYDTKRTSMYDALEESMFNIDMERTEKFAQIDSNITGLKAERRVQDERSREKFLGIF